MVNILATPNGMTLKFPRKNARMARSSVAIWHPRMLGLSHTAAGLGPLTSSWSAPGLQATDQKRTVSRYLAARDQRQLPSMPSTHKKVVVRKMDRDSINGFVAPANFVQD